MKTNSLLTQVLLVLALTSLTTAAVVPQVTHAAVTPRFKVAINKSGLKYDLRKRAVRNPKLLQISRNRVELQASAAETDAELDHAQRQEKKLEAKIARLSKTSSARLRLRKNVARLGETVLAATVRPYFSSGTSFIGGTVLLLFQLPLWGELTAGTEPLDKTLFLEGLFAVSWAGIVAMSGVKNSKQFGAWESAELIRRGEGNAQDVQTLENSGFEIPTVGGDLLPASRSPVQKLFAKREKARLEGEHFAKEKAEAIKKDVQYTRAKAWATAEGHEVYTGGGGSGAISSLKTPFGNINTFKRFNFDNRWSGGSTSDDNSDKNSSSRSTSKNSKSSPRRSSPTEDSSPNNASVDTEDLVIAGVQAASAIISQQVLWNTGFNTGGVFDLLSGDDK